jgi:Cadherin domain
MENLVTKDYWNPIIEKPFTSPWRLLKLRMETDNHQPLSTRCGNLCHDNFKHLSIKQKQIISNYFDVDAYFSLLPIAGLIRTKSRIDYEQVKQIRFSVEVTDTGIPQLTSTAQIHVNVMNINDNAPQFNETEYHLNVNENAMKRTSIGSVYAHDADEGN